MKIILIAFLFALLPFASVSADNHKVFICHRNQGDPQWNLIEIAESALDAHLSHQWGGDIYPVPANGCPQVETPTEVVTETPTEVVTETPTETPTEIVTETPTEVVTETPTETPVVTETPDGTEEETPTSTVVATETPTTSVGQTPTETLVPTDGELTTSAPVVDNVHVAAMPSTGSGQVPHKTQWEMFAGIAFIVMSAGAAIQWYVRR